MPKCVCRRPEFRLAGSACRRTVPWEHTIIYELHYPEPSSIPKLPKNGAALQKAFRKVIEYIQVTGVTSVELLPVHTFTTTVCCSTRG